MGLSLERLSGGLAQAGLDHDFVEGRAIAASDGSR
jgi:hypothetical protein